MSRRTFWPKLVLGGRMILWGTVFSYGLMAVGTKTSSSTNSEAIALGLIGAFCGVIIGMTFNSLSGFSTGGTGRDDMDGDP